MEFAILSDLHLEFSNFDVTIPPEINVLVLAGDIHCEIPQLAKWTAELLNKHPGLHIVFVAGNHEYYNKSIPQTKLEIRTHCVHPRFHYLDNDSIVIKNVCFVGGTLWATVLPEDEKLFTLSQNDFKRIIGLSTDVMRMEQEACLSSIIKACAEHSRVVVVTHFGVTKRGCHPKYGHPDMLINRYFNNDLNWFVQKYEPAIWVHGHTHASLDYEVIGDTKETRVVCNPRGYDFNNNGHRENEEFVFIFTVEV